MNITYCVSYTAYFDWSKYGSCLSSGLSAETLPLLTLKVRSKTNELLKSCYRRIEFSDITVEMRGAIPIKAISSRVVRRRRKR